MSSRVVRCELGSKLVGGKLGKLLVTGLVVRYASMCWLVRVERFSGLVQWELSENILMSIRIGS